MLRRTYLLAAGLGIAAIAALFTLRHTSAEQAKDAAVKPTVTVAKTERDEQPTTKLPIGQVVLFSSGVGYFQREGTVEGTTRVDLSFSRYRTSTTCSSQWCCAISTADTSRRSPTTPTLRSSGR